MKSVRDTELQRYTDIEKLYIQIYIEDRDIEILYIDTEICREEIYRDIKRIEIYSVIEILSDRDT